MRFLRGSWCLRGACWLRLTCLPCAGLPDAWLLCAGLPDAWLPGAGFRCDRQVRCFCRFRWAAGREREQEREQEREREREREQERERGVGAFGAVRWTGHCGCFPRRS